MYLFWESYMYMCVYIFLWKPEAGFGNFTDQSHFIKQNLCLIQELTNLHSFVSLIWMTTVLTSRVLRIQVAFMPSWFDMSISNSNSNLYTYRQTLYPLSHFHKSRIWIILTCINIMQISINYLFRKFCFEGKPYRICNLCNNLYH